MAMRWSRCVGDACRRRARARPRPTRLASPSRQATPFASSPRATAARRSDSLTRSSSQPLHHRAALGEGGGDGEHRIFVDHGGRALRRHGHALQPRGAHAHVADRLAAGEALVLDREVGAHLAAASRCRPVRAGLRSTFSTVTSEPSTSRPATMRKAAELGSAGTVIACGFSSGRPTRRIVVAPSRGALDRDVGAEALQHALGMVARGDRLDDGGDALDVEAGEQHGRLHLRRRHRHAIGDRRHRVGAADRQRQAVAGAGDHLRPHFAQRVEHARPSAGATARRRRRRWWRRRARRQCRAPGARRCRHCRSR